VRRGTGWTPTKKRGQAALSASSNAGATRAVTLDTPPKDQRAAVAVSAPAPKQPSVQRAEASMTEVASTPAVAPGPIAPVDPPVEWALLTLARRPVRDVPHDTPSTLTTAQSVGDDIAGINADGAGAYTPTTIEYSAPESFTARVANASLATNMASVTAAVPFDSTADLQARFDALRPGDTLTLDAGTFDYSRSLYIRTSNVSIIGNGTTLNSTNPANAAISILADNVTLSNLNLTGPVGLERVDSTYRTRLVFGGDGVHISDVHITGGTSAGIYVTGGSNFLIERVTIQDTGADGIQITNGSNNGTINDVTTLRTGDDAIAIVSYQLPLYGTVHDITVNNPIVDGSGQRGLVVVGGQRITFNNINVSNTALAGVFIGSQALYFIRATEDVHVNGGIVTEGGSGGAPGGAVLIWSTNRNQPVSNVTIENLTLVNTPRSAYFNVGIWADVVLGAAVRNVVIRNIAIEQPLQSSPVPFFVIGAASDSYSMTGFTVNGVPVGDATPPDTPERQFGDAVISISNVLATVSNRIVDLWDPIKGAIDNGVGFISGVLDAFAWVPFVPLINFELNQAWIAIAGTGDAVTGLAHDLINAGNLFVIETLRGDGLIAATANALSTTLDSIAARGGEAVQVLADWGRAQLDYFIGLVTPGATNASTAPAAQRLVMSYASSTCGVDQPVPGSCFGQPTDLPIANAELIRAFGPPSGVGRKT
jgi:Right handed beta helix region